VRAHGLPAYERYDQAVQLVGPAEARAVSPALSVADNQLFDDRRRYFEQVPADDPVGQMLRLDFHTSLVDSLLQFTDKMSMATSLEARVPLLDHELVEAVAAIPSSAKIRRGRLRVLQKKSMESRLPTRVLKKRKRGFGCPVGAWFRSDLRTLLHDTLAEDRLRRQGLLDAARVQSLMADHESQREDRTDLLLALFTFQLWRDEWRVGTH
jgi:asparagine synthase (glutamine-hydrolysing)